ncbi:hypothetical protein, partial [Klebsiella pneumoniae]|uniref:hypothetical protein n=1 Tax=Klebsiella pneumoniae TaxID=573 RepID=UPI0034A19D91
RGVEITRSSKELTVWINATKTLYGHHPTSDAPSPRNKTTTGQTSLSSMNSDDMSDVLKEMRSRSEDTKLINTIINPMF